jgi:hypothetical protein
LADRATERVGNALWAQARARNFKSSLELPSSSRTAPAATILAHSDMESARARE